MGYYLMLLKWQIVYKVIMFTPGLLASKVMIQLDSQFHELLVNFPKNSNSRFCFNWKINVM